MIRRRRKVAREREIHSPEFVHLSSARFNASGLTSQMSRAPRRHDRMGQWARRLHLDVMQPVALQGQLRPNA